MISVILNLPWTVAGLLMALCSAPKRIRLHFKPFAVTVYARSFWYLDWLSTYRGVRAITLGHCVVISRFALPNDLEHELIHIEQTNRAPFIHPFLYFLENLRHPGKANKYEREAYSRSHSTYIG